MLDSGAEKCTASNQSLLQMLSNQICLLKVCGVTRPDQAAALKQVGVNLLGLNFHPKSPRFVENPLAKELVRAWGDPSTVVGVFVDLLPEEIFAIRDQTGIGIAQLHGDEPPETVAEVASEMQVIRAFRIKDETSLELARIHINQLLERGQSLTAALIDGYCSTAHGGTGVTVGESLVKKAVNLHPRLILAGGLTTENIDDRLDWVRPWAIDVASGVESSPGIKNLEAVSKMLDRIRSK